MAAFSTELLTLAGPHERIFTVDGYGNSRIIEYTAHGKKVRQWGRFGSLLGEFNLPHFLQIEKGTIYIADRENGRIQVFDLAGHYYDEIFRLGKICAFKLAGGVIWTFMGLLDELLGAAGWWVVKLDRRTDKVLGHLGIIEPSGDHAL